MPLLWIHHKGDVNNCCPRFVTDHINRSCIRNGDTYKHGHLENILCKLNWTLEHQLMKFTTFTNNFTKKHRENIIINNKYIFKIL